MPPSFSVPHTFPEHAQAPRARTASPDCSCRPREAGVQEPQALPQKQAATPHLLVQPQSPEHSQALREDQLRKISNPRDANT